MQASALLTNLRLASNQFSGTCKSSYGRSIAATPIQSCDLRIQPSSRPPEFLEGGGRRLAIVPTLTIVSANGQRVESLNFQLGVLEAGSTSWKYVEGSRINKENVQVLFPGFPQDYEFPKFYRKKL
jgi:hypothetical protein